MNNKTQQKIDLGIRYIFFIAFFIFIAWGVKSLGGETDLMFDRFFMGAYCLFIAGFYKRFHFNISIALFAALAIYLHSAKFYGQTYFGFIQFDMIMHFVATFVIAMAIFSYLINSEKGISIAKTVVIVIFIVAGLATIIEILEFFGYANLPPGEGILHYGTGDVGGWADATLDMIFNLVGSFSGAFISGVVYKIKNGRRLKK